jgi:hypothetical protein
MPLRRAAVLQLIGDGVGAMDGVVYGRPMTSQFCKEAYSTSSHSERGLSSRGHRRSSCSTRNLGRGRSSPAPSVFPHDHSDATLPSGGLAAAVEESEG